MINARLQEYLWGTLMNNKIEKSKSSLRFVASSKKGQEELIGFGLIIVIVAVILLVLLGFSLSSKDEQIIQSYEVESFLQSMLMQTTDCRDKLEYSSVQELIFRCNKGDYCEDNRDSCKVLNQTLTNILSDVWVIQDRPIKGYKLTILSGEEEFLLIQKGNLTNNYKGAVQPFSRGGMSFNVNFIAAY